MNKLPEKLIQLRKGKGYSQQAVAEKIGVSVQEYMAWENGSALPGIDRLIQFAELYGLTVDEMIRNAAAPLPEKNQEEPLTIPFQKKAETPVSPVSKTAESSDEQAEEETETTLEQTR